jgi:hypothetical protein
LELLQSSIKTLSFTPRLKQPWAEISQRLRRYFKLPSPPPAKSS